MKDSLENRASPFEGLHEPQISTLVGLLQESRVKNREYIERRYLEDAPQFDRTLQFLTEIVLCRMTRAS